MFSILSKVPFWIQTLIGFGLGIAAGLYWGTKGTLAFDAIGNSFINLIKMMVMPLVFFTIVASISRITKGRDSQSGAEAIRLGFWTLIWFMITAALASGVGLLIGSYFQPGNGVVLGAITPKAVKEIATPLDVVMGIIPSNIFKSFVEGKVLSVVFFAILVGAAMGALGEKANKLAEIMEQASEVMFTLTRWIIKLTPIGVFGLIASVVGAYGLASLSPLLPYIGLIYLGCFVILLGVYPLLLKLHGLNVFAFYRHIFTAQQTAFFTCSSLATLPVSLGVGVEKLKISKPYAGFAIPIGANMKMDGCGGIYPAITSIFIANYFGIELTTTHYILIALTSVLGSLATAGIPSAATVMLTLTLSTAGLPLEGLALVAAIDRIIDMIRTATNVTGQILIPTLVARENGLIEKDSPILPQKLSSLRS